MRDAEKTAQDLLHAALQVPVDNRMDYLNAACGADTELRASVERLLQSHEEQANPKRFSTQDIATVDTNPPGVDGSPPTEGLRPGDDHSVSDTNADLTADTWGRSGMSGTMPSAKGKRFHDYELLEEIARGGMGVVYKARQLSLNRIVALKMIKSGDLANEEQIERFRKEAEAAANLDHPGIVPVYQVGEHEGQHFFSMGYVEGPSLANRLSEGPIPPDEAARLTCRIADAVAYAHSRGVIHRDLKPGNVLLAQSQQAETENHGGDSSHSSHVSASIRESQPRITDFGLAKRIEEDSQLTSTGQVLGTPSYMPPEQASGKLEGIGPAADVYALGAILYSLLTGRPPFQAASVVDTLRQVVEQDPVPPSRLNRSIPADLETITLKCLQKTPDRRYATAQDVADDLQRLLDGRPILARPPSIAEQFIKWTRRHPARAALMVVVTLGLIGTSAGMAWAFSERGRANAAATRATQAAELARVREKTATNVLSYMIQMFEAAGPEQANGEPMTVVEYLHIGASRIDELDDEPEVQAELMEAIGWLFIVLSEFDDAKPLLERALAYRESHPGPGEQDLASALHALASLYQWTGQFDEVKKLENRAIAIWQRDPERKGELAQCVNVLGNAFQRDGDLDEAEQHYQRALALIESVSPNSSHAALILHNLGIVRFFSSDYEAAEELYRKVIDIEAQTLGEDSHHLATTKHVLSIANTFQGRLESALRWQLEAKATREKVLPAGHDHIALSLVSLANIYREMDRLEESERLLREGIRIHESLYEPSNGELQWDKECLFLTLVELGQLDEAEAELKAQVEIIEGTGSPTGIANVRLNQALLSWTKEDLETARDRAREAQSTIEEAGFNGGSLFVRVHMMLAKIEATLGNLEAADVHYQKAADMVIQMDKQLTYRTLTMKAEYAEALFENGARELASDVYRDVKGSYLKIVAEPEADVFFSERAARFLLACNCVNLRDPEMALKLAAQAVDQSLEPSAHYLETLALATSANGNRKAAIEKQQEAIERLEKGSFWQASFEETLQSIQDDAQR